VPHSYTDLLVRPTQWEKNTKFGTWNARCLLMSVPLITAVRELARYRLDIVSVQEVRWDKVSTVRAGDCPPPPPRKKKKKNKKKGGKRN